MNAYDVLTTNTVDKPIDHQRFYALVSAFRKAFLEEEHYQERLAVHRQPNVLKNELLQVLYARSKEINSRPEMQFINAKTNGLSYVTSMIKHRCENDKRIKTLYELVQHHCAEYQADLNNIAAHVAEYRALDKLMAKFKRETMAEQVASAKIYTFDDWLHGDLWRAKTLGGEYMANDSERYVELAGLKRMSFEEVNKIQDAQQQAYDYLIESSLRLRLQHFRRMTKDTLDIEYVVAEKLKAINAYFQQHQTVCNEVMLPKKHRGIKWGAKFLLPQHYQAFLNKGLLDVNVLESSTYGIRINGQMTHFPTPEQLRYAEMEVEIRWFYILHGYKERQRFEAMMTVKDFKELIDRYGNEQELTDQYQKGLEFAPDWGLYTQNRIALYEEILPKYSAGIGVRDETSHAEIIVNVGEYKRIGYTWVNNGHNATHYDLETSTLRNVTLCPSTAPERRYAIYCQVLHQLAVGGALAFHLAFLRKRLKGEESLPPAKPISRSIWQGDPIKRGMLFDELASAGFLEAGDGNKAKFLNNHLVQWMQDARSLLYLLNELKSKSYRFLLATEALSPVVRDNFINRHGLPFKNIKQNLNGMTSANKTGKPRLAPQIDEVLTRLMEP